MRGFVRRPAREMRGCRTVGDKGQLRGSEGQPVYAGVPGRCRGRDVREVRGAQEMQGQGCQSAGGYNKGPGVERPRGQGLCI